MRRATVDLPQPDSPTSESVSPRLIVKEMPSTARRICRGARSITRFSHGRETSKSLTRSFTSRRASPAFTTESGMHRSVAPVLLRSRRGHLRGMQPARSEGFVGGKQVRPLGLAAIEDARAARIEGTARGNRVQARHRALDLRQALQLLS